MTRPSALVGPDTVPSADAAAIETGALALVREGEIRLRLTGSGRVACLQGLITSDVAKSGEGSRSFGALLTNKGMIVAPLWISRLSDATLLELPAAAASAVHEVFAKSLPPRLCRSEDVTGTTIALGVYGPRASEVLARVLGPFPAGAAEVSYASGRVAIAPAVLRGVGGFDLVAGAGLARALMDDLLGQGATAGSATALERARILAGIPRLGAEIDDRTLPQEVRYEELGAISFTKGCYLGQETVARIHFRGHANRRLAGLALEDAPASLPQELRAEGRAVGRLTSAAWMPDLGRWFALGVIRRELAAGAEIATDLGATATVLADPWTAA
jgi:folate-binding protein YgfZ